MSNFPDFPDFPDFPSSRERLFNSTKTEAMIKEQQLAREKMQQAKDTMEFLNIPVEDFGIVCVPLMKLYHILMDETKRKEIMTKLNNKALW